jgi:hypothetical protein
LSPFAFRDEVGSFIMSVFRSSAIRLLPLACLLVSAGAEATKVRFNGLPSPTAPYDLTTQGYLFEFVATPSSDVPTILPSGPSPHGSDSYAFCGYCYATSSFNIYRDDGTQFDLAKMEIGAVGGLPAEDFDFTFTGNLTAGGTVVHTANISVGGGVGIVTFDATWRDLASVNVSIDNTGNTPFAISTVDNIELHQTPTITYGNPPVTDGGGFNIGPKPVAFDGFILDGVTYDLTVYWGASYDNVYTTPPMFEWIQFPPVPFGSSDTADEIRYALLRDAYVPLPPLSNNHNGAFTLVPGATAFTAHWGAAVELDLVGLAVNPNLLFADNIVPTSQVIDYIGWVRFQQVSQLVFSQLSSGNSGNKFHPHHDGSAAAIGGLNDPFSVVVLGSSVENGGTEDFFTGEIEPDSVQVGPAMGGQDPDLSPDYDIDVNADGDLDARFHFLTGDSGLTCADTEMTLTGVADGNAFESTESVTTDCNFQCH